MILIFFMADFLRYAPCMRKVKTEYEKCSESYKNIMKKISEEKTAEVFTSAATTTTTSTPPRRVQISLMKRQQTSQSIYVSLETTTISAVKNLTSDAIDQGEVQIKKVCWWARQSMNDSSEIQSAFHFLSAFQEYMKCSEAAVETACGPETAEFTRNFLDKMLSSLIRVSCCQLKRFLV